MINEKIKTLERKKAKKLKEARKKFRFELDSIKLEIQRYNQQLYFNKQQQEWNTQGFISTITNSNIKEREPVINTNGGVKNGKEKFNYI